MRSYQILSLFSFVALTSASKSLMEGDDKGPAGYHNRNGTIEPSKWFTVSPECAGKKQSPVNIQINHKLCRMNSLPLSFHGSCTSANLEKHKTDYTWQIQGGTCQASLDGQNYPLKQFHMHSPSEHTINGNHYDIEIHLVHVLDDQIVVIGVLLDAEDNAEDDPWVKQAFQPLNDDSATNPIEVMEVYNLLSNEKHYFNYAGSLTTPPCTQAVNWWVMKKPRIISKAQLHTLLSKLSKLPLTDNGKNSRPVQDLNGRNIMVY